jgi:hypothetical protein
LGLESAVNPVRPAAPAGDCGDDVVSRLKSEGRLRRLADTLAIAGEREADEVAKASGACRSE